MRYRKRDAGRAGIAPVFLGRLEHGGGMGKKQYFYVYTLLFLLTACLVFSWYFLAGRTLIWEMDGWKQHYKALVYYARYLRSILHGVFVQHQLSIPAWDFCIGEGSDILTTFHYYVIGDPFSLFSVFVPTRFMYLYYEAMVLLRMYLAGAAFSCLCFRTGIKHKGGVLAGSMAYVFCFWALRNAARHPYFLNPMIYFPLLLLGVERILGKKKPNLFVFAVFLSAISNVYFFYMLVLLTVLYVGARLIAGYRRRVREGLCMLLRIGLSSILGVMLAAVVLLPMCYVLLGDTRVSSGRVSHMLYPFSYYGRLPGLFISAGAEYWLCMGFAVPVLVALFWFLFKEKGYGFLKGLFLICLTIIAFPILGRALNGFSYVANRWCWAFALLLAYVLAAVWPKLMGLKARDARFLYMCLTAYLLACVVLEPSRSGDAFLSVALGYLFVWILYPVRKGKELFGQHRKESMALLLVLSSIFNHSFWHSTPAGKNYAAECMELSEVKHGLMANETPAVQAAAQAEGAEGFYRFSGNRPVQNANVVSGLSSTQYYWSISNHYASGFRKDMELREADTYNYRGYDSRAALLSLAAVRYYAVPNDSTGKPPYGFVEAPMAAEGMQGQEGKYTVYRNEYLLPLTYSYDSYVPADAWEKLSSVQKQEALLQGVVLEGDMGNPSDGGADGFPQAKLHFTDQEIVPAISCKGEGISQQGNTFVVTQEDAKATLEFQGLEGCETYLSIQGLYYQEVQEPEGQEEQQEAVQTGQGGLAGGQEVQQEVKQEAVQAGQEWPKEAGAQNTLAEDGFSWNTKEGIKMQITSSIGEEKPFTYYTEESSHYSGRHDFTVNLGYSKEAVRAAEILFEKPGVYSFGSIGIVCQPMEGYGRAIQRLKEDSLEQMEIKADTVTGRISLERAKILCFAIPYSEGWKAYVDGKEAVPLRANGMYLAVPLGAGEHEIQMVYHTPLLREGLWVSFFGLALSAALALVQGYRRKDREGRKRKDGGTCGYH